YQYWWWPWRGRRRELGPLNLSDCPVNRMQTVRIIRRQEQGSVLVLVGDSLAVLIGFLGVVWDLGRLFVTKTELQSAMDACALAASAELKQDADAINRAVSAAITAGTRNKVGFQAASVDITAADIYFSDRLSDNTTTFPFGYLSSATADPTTARYAMCSKSEDGIATAFMQVIKSALAEASTPNSVGAWATATLAPSQISCAIPVGLCSQGAGPGFGFNVGQWYKGRFGAGEGGTGSYNWIDFNPGETTPGCSGGGSNELRCLFAGPGQCNLPAPGTQVGQQGEAQNIAQGWNSRFGLYQGSINLSNAAPDFSGLAYASATTEGAQEVTWPSGFNAYSGSAGGGSTTVNFLDARLSHSTYQASNPMDVSNGYKGITSGQHASNGADRRIAVAPIVDCAQLAESNPQTVPVLGYACIFMLHPISGPDDVELEYRGTANDSGPGNPCSTGGLGGGTAGPLVPVLVH
ncbi:MAG: pilus assembly protein TadG-related protein, partial [Gammaproteobacteria bacterium]